ncbi:MAG: response regulator [Cyclobacteriaceae bacterium]|nr:response regulator [Cyclobacteriaceae bacterium]
MKDSKGFIWFGAADGLWRYDGYNLVHFKKTEGDTTTLSDNYIFSLFEDSKKRIWVGTLHGSLNLYHPETNSFTHMFTTDSVLRTDCQINNFAETDEGIWIASSRGLHLFGGEKLLHLFLSKGHSINGFRTHIRSLLPDSTGQVWLGGYGGGLGLYNHKTRSIRLISEVPQKRASYILRMVFDQYGSIWVLRNAEPNNEGGLFRIDFRAGKSLDITVNELTGNGNDLLFDLLVADSLVIASASSGIYYFVNPNDINRPHVVEFSKVHNLPTFVAFRLLLENNRLWVGTENHGTYSISIPTNTKFFKSPAPMAKLSNVWHGKKRVFLNFDDHGLIVFDSLQKTSHTIPARNDRTGYSVNTVWSLLEYHDNIWLGTYDGVFVFDSKTRPVTKFLFTADTTSLSSNSVTALFEDSKNRLWILTDGGGWSVFNEAKRNFSRGSKQSGAGHSVVNIVETKSGLWIGSVDGGLTLVSRESLKPLKYFRHETGKPHTLSNNRVTSLFSSREGDLWVGTNAGLCRYDTTTEHFIRYGYAQGLNEEPITQIFEGHESLMVQTTSGLFQMKRNDGLGFKKVYAPVSLTPSSGVLHWPYFTWTQGDYLGSLRLDRAQLKSAPPPVVITDFKLDPNNKNPLDSARARLNPTYLQSIELEYDQNLFSIEFAALSFENVNSNQYAYKLEGFDEDWTFSGTRRFVTYTNIDPGEYSFHVKAANEQGVWNEEGAQLKITILPPPWRTWWAYTGYGLIFVGLLYGARKIVVNRERLKAQVALGQRERETLRELDRLKTNFFSNITHEFRTPLTLIQGPAEQLLESAKDEDEKRMLGIINSNAQRLLKLINQLLDLARVDVKETVLNPKPTALHPLLRINLSQFESLAADRNITYRWQLPESLPNALVDGEKLETIIINLISNALKFTPAGGSVLASIGLETPELILTVEDTGRGIPHEKLANIFERFYQVESANSQYSEGTGIGLALVKEYAELMKGRISVHSVVGQGTRFDVRLPLTITSEEVQLQESNPSQPVQAEGPANGSPDLPLLLLADDNEDIRVFIKTCLGKTYRYAEAKDGGEALRQAREHLPDLIISDVMMPVMDGIALCNEIKTDTRTNHIPFIMLTAKSADESRLKGLRTGADEYVIKPFDKTELVLRVQNLLSLQQKLRDHIQREVLTAPDTPNVKSANEVFVWKAKTFIEENLKEEKLSVELLADHLNLSREQCYRKLTSLTGLSPSALIRKIRLLKAQHLLQNKWGNISQVAFEVGFESLSHFTKAYKEQFGYRPSET